MINDDKRPRDYTEEQYVKSTEEMLALFADLPEAIDNTLQIARRCTLSLSFGTYYLPDYPVPDGHDTNSWLKLQAQLETVGPRLELTADYGKLTILSQPLFWLLSHFQSWLGNFGLTGLVTGVLALALAVLLAARISRPFAQLARDAERLGRGDLDTPVPKPRTFLSEPVAAGAHRFLLMPNAVLPAAPSTHSKAANMRIPYSIVYPQ